MVENVAVIGAGVIGGAIIKCLQESKDVGRVVASRRSFEALQQFKKIGAEITTDNRFAASKADVIFLCVKPNDILGVLKEIQVEAEGKLVISTAAIVSLEYLHRTAPMSRFVRTMPNIAALVGEAFTAYTCDPACSLKDKETVKVLLDSMGVCVEVEEKYMDAVTGLSGSSPAFLGIVIDALMFAGLKVGLPRELALYSAAQSMLGTAKLIIDGAMKPADIAEMVTTPGGTTIEGIYMIEDGKLRTALMNAVEAATEKCTTIREQWEKKL